MNVDATMAATATFTATIAVKCDFRSARAKKRMMASKGKKPRARWDSETERKLIDIWADIQEEFSDKMMTRKKIEAIASTRLNVYVSEELIRPDKYSEKEVYNKLDTILKKGKSMYVNYQKKVKRVKDTPKMMQILTLKQRKGHGRTLRPSSNVKTIQPWVQVQWRNLALLQVSV